MKDEKETSEFDAPEPIEVPDDLEDIAQANPVSWSNVRGGTTLTAVLNAGELPTIVSSHNLPIL